MKQSVWSVRVLWLLIAGVMMSMSAGWSLLAQTSSQPTARQAAAVPPGLVARGEYLATSVAMCVQCHSGRDGQGNVLESQKFRGGPIPVRSPYQNKPFATQAPNLSGLPGFTDEQVVSLLTTGKATGRRAPRPPMPPFRMERADAEAIVAFLRSRG